MPTGNLIEARRDEWKQMLALFLFRYICKIIIYL